MKTARFITAIIICSFAIFSAAQAALASAPPIAQFGYMSQTPPNEGYMYDSYDNYMSGSYYSNYTRPTPSPAAAPVVSPSVTASPAYGVSPAATPAPASSPATSPVSSPTPSPATATAPALSPGSPQSATAAAQPGSYLQGTSQNQPLSPPYAEEMLRKINASVITGASAVQSVQSAGLPESSGSPPYATPVAPPANSNPAQPAANTSAPAVTGSPPPANTGAPTDGLIQTAVTSNELSDNNRLILINVTKPNGGETEIVYKNKYTICGVRDENDETNEPIVLYLARYNAAIGRYAEYSDVDNNKRWTMGANSVFTISVLLEEGENQFAIAACKASVIEASQAAGKPIGDDSVQIERFSILYRSQNVAEKISEVLKELTIANIIKEIENH